jgi:26S proteasome regulatory subunit T5
MDKGMNTNPDVNFEELARSTEDFNGAQLKAVCVEAGMLALRREAEIIDHGASPFRPCRPTS